ncbi:unnamed protein product [Arctia plantaginis]|uniref:Uncharacterized protein n=1 Tax=Arctia plantaginis TaxID=874455 RepID=A0A8S0YYK2_ARCPL|nr:unnamed protein product [Arctia plantaginis]
MWQTDACATKTTTNAVRFYKMKLETTVALLIMSTCFGAPVDDPIRIDLPIYDEPQEKSNILSAYPLQPENYPGGDPLNSNQVTGGNLVSPKLQNSNYIHNSGIFAAPVTVRENALQETEGYGSKALSFKDGIQEAYAGIFQPKPIVDTIRESEKYGNTGDKFYTAGRAIVGGAEGFANFVNSVLEIPGKVFKSITRSATEKLNNLGGKLSGL